ncbi:Protein of unknown function (DUF2939) [Beggiatoa alba B18LD]|uniref:DUF4189 domain-containing protein n=1 Tax=Beggiatoa alba B18LD TaxID=395493 RepID=I3CD51_9GAMM|nr:DUF4189 domain-containing protein [Beggiatoa alba]EIJ41544.1 Protein of unknown function (DUF2939) [Beggiatoa alba B18LD]
MTEPRYRVVFRGEIQQEKDIEQVKTQLAQITKQSPEKIALLFSGKPVTILKDADEITAKRYQTAFQKAGAICYIQTIPSPTVETTANPTPTVSSPSTADTTPSPIPKKVPLKIKPKPVESDIFSHAEEVSQTTGKKKIVFISLFFIFLLLLGGTLFATPYISVWQMKKAYEAKNADVLNSYIDYPTLRTNLKAQVASLIEKSLQTMPAPPTDAGNPAGSPLEMAKPLIESVIDQSITPETLAKILTENMGSDEAQMIRSSEEKAKLSYENFSTFLVTVDAQGTPISVIFSRVNMIYWQVTDVRIPQEVLNLPLMNAGNLMNVPNPNGENTTEETAMSEPIAEPASPDEHVVKPNAYGALAYSTTSGMHGFSAQRATQAEAEQEALNRCNGLTEKKDCQVLSPVNNACIALVKASVDATIFGWAWNDTQQEAEERAMQDCKERNPDCRLQQSFCSK